MSEKSQVSARECLFVKLGFFKLFFVLTAWLDQLSVLTIGSARQFSSKLSNTDLIHDSDGTWGPEYNSIRIIIIQC